MTRREMIEALAVIAGSGWAMPALAGQGAGAPQAAAAASAAASGVGPVNLAEYEAVARRRISRMAYEYVAGGAGDEVTLRWNRECFDAMKLKPRVLRDVSSLDTQVEVLGQKQASPILLAPTAYHKLLHREGESATARGAGAAGATMVVSSFATVGIEDVAKAATAPLWFQLYVQEDRGFTKELVQRAEGAGCKALVVTVDSPVLGSRNREDRVKFALPPGMQRENLKSLGEQKSTGRHAGEGSIYSVVLDPKLTWEGIDWIRSYAKVPVVLKGILAAEDARLAVEHGAAGVVVSNHGARNLDTIPATIEALGGVVEAVEGRIPVLMDGGVRRGTDVVKALALGARAVLIGRPQMWGLGANGAAGVESVVRMLQKEFAAAMALCGVGKAVGIDKSVLWDGKAGR